MQVRIDSVLCSVDTCWKLHTRACMPNLLLEPLIVQLQKVLLVTAADEKPL